MSHRNGKPKTNASERTKYRWRDRHDVSTVQDKERKTWFQTIKEKIIRERVEAEQMKNG